MRILRIFPWVAVALLLLASERPVTSSPQGISADSWIPVSESFGLVVVGTLAAPIEASPGDVVLPQGESANAGAVCVPMVRVQGVWRVVSWPPSPRRPEIVPLADDPR